MKNHTTITITNTLIKTYGPCTEGYNQAREVLPVNISTDPEQNIDLAIMMANTYTDTNFPDELYQLIWLVRRICGTFVFEDICKVSWDSTAHQRGVDIGITCQALHPYR